MKIPYKIIPYLFITIVTTLSCNQDRTEEALKDINLYSKAINAILDTNRLSNQKSDSLWLIYNYHPDDLRAKCVQKELARQNDSTIKETLNKLLYIVDDSLKFPVEINNTSNKRSIYFRNHQTDSFYSGIVNLSPICYNSDNAAFYLAYQCGGSCGKGYIVLLAKSSLSQWEIKQAILVWK